MAAPGDSMVDWAGVCTGRGDKLPEDEPPYVQILENSRRQIAELAPQMRHDAGARSEFLELLVATKATLRWSAPGASEATIGALLGQVDG